MAKKPNRRQREADRKRTYARQRAALVEEFNKPLLTREQRRAALQAAMEKRQHGSD